MDTGGDGYTGTNKGIGSVKILDPDAGNADGSNTGNIHGRQVAMYDSASGLGQTDVPGTFTTGQTVTYSHSWGAGARYDKDGVFIGTFVAPAETKYMGVAGTMDQRTYMVVWDPDPYGGRFVLLGYNPDTADLTKLIQSFQGSMAEDSIVKENHFVCFLSGTLVATPDGERDVESLTSGDVVLTSDGRAVPAQWIGQQTVMTFFGPPERLMPVRFAKGSLGEGLPHSDLTVTSDHAILVDGVLCQASSLVNGTTVTRVPLSEFGRKYTVYHVETERHEIILANGVPAETFVDNVSRRAFDNYAEYEALFGENPPEMQELPHPRASNARQLPLRIRNRFGISDAREVGKVA